MDEAYVIVSFCNQISSPGRSLCILNTSNGDSRWIDLSNLPKVLRQDYAGICGICRVGDDVVIATQGAAPALASVNITDATITSYTPLEKSRDTHSLVFHEGYLYLVSTGTNEIYKVSIYKGQFGREELAWGYPGVSYDKDEVHLNGLTIDGGRLIASCFGPKKADGSWNTEGRVFYVESGLSIQGGLNQPHSPLITGRRLIFAESAAHKVYIYNKSESDEWRKEKEICLRGYTRGLVLTDDRLLVGVSSNRKLSKSQRKFLDTTQQESVDSKIVEINLSTGRQVDSLSLLGFGREIYDMALTNTSPTMLPAHDAISTRIGEMESSVDKYVADLSRVYLENIEISKRLQQSQLDLQQSRLDLQQIHNELLRYTQSTSWRITAPVRAAVNLWHRLKSLLQGTGNSL